MMQRRMDALFGDFSDFFGLPGPAFVWETSGRVPSVDVSETDGEVRFEAELPGLEEKDVEVTLEDDVLTLKGSVENRREEEDRNYHVTERAYGSFERAFRLPKGTDREKAKAVFTKGILTVTVPKTEEARDARRKIEIES
jgi:HSP20 family protein